jgi:hypothetical protein
VNVPDAVFLERKRVDRLELEMQNRGRGVTLLVGLGGLAKASSTPSLKMNTPLAGSSMSLPACAWMSSSDTLPVSSLRQVT